MFFITWYFINYSVPNLINTIIIGYLIFNKYQIYTMLYEFIISEAFYYQKINKKYNIILL